MSVSPAGQIAGPQGAACGKGFAGQKLMRVELPVADRPVIGKRIAGHMFHRIRFGNAPPRFANHQRDFAFIVELPAFERAQHGLIMPNQAVGKPREYDRVFGHAKPCFQHMFSKVQANTKDSGARQQGRQQRSVHAGLIRRACGKVAGPAVQCGADIGHAAGIDDIPLQHARAGPSSL